MWIKFALWLFLYWFSIVNYNHLITYVLDLIHQKDHRACDGWITFAFLCITFYFNTPNKNNYWIYGDFMVFSINSSTSSKYFFEQKKEIEKPHQKYQDQPHQIIRGIIHLYSMWKIQKSQYMWKIHINSTFFSENVINHFKLSSILP